MTIDISSQTLVFLQTIWTSNSVSMGSIFYDFLNFENWIEYKFVKITLFRVLQISLV